VAFGSGIGPAGCAGPGSWRSSLSLDLGRSGPKTRPAQGPRTQYDARVMRALKAQVRGGRLVLDEPTELPEGTEVELTLVEDDEFDPEERARLDAALELSMAQARAGQFVDGEVVIRKLLDRG
jgi:hypothetical protein